ncbi:hypothetical protein ACMGG8_15750 [Pseudomonas sp. BNK-45]|uniref:hypothetical protein n=1 Tax=Pseudomonas sp. BNK-45 TaxID=3376180 RepID=UPI0039BFE569
MFMFDGFLLLLTVIVPVVLAVSIVVFVVGVGDCRVEKIKSIFKLDSSKGLIGQGLLWLSIFIPLFLALSLGFWVWPNYQVDLSLEGYRKFIEVSLLPLGMMSISLPLTGLVARFHSTQQTARQIEVVSAKNNLDAFYSHRKEMISYFSSMGEIEYLKSVKFVYGIHPVLHLRFFEGAPDKGLPLVNRESFDYVEGKILFASKLLASVLLGEGGGIGLLNSYLNACDNIYLAAKALAIKEVCNSLVAKGVEVKSDSGESGSITIGTTTLEVLAAIRFVKGYYDNLCDFSGVPRMKVPEGRGVVFRGGQKLLDGELFIEALHRGELANLVAEGRARYSEDHPSICKKQES